MVFSLRTILFTAAAPLAALLCSWPANPQPASGPASSDHATAPDVQSSPRINRTGASPGDDLINARQLTLRFSSHPELNGNYRINADQTISIPVVGRVPVGGLDAKSLEQVLGGKISNLTGRNSYVTVEVAEYRPIYVTGFVNSSGAAQWHPRMTVLQAVAAAGGVFRRAQGTALTGDPVRRLRAIDEQKRMLATQARLLAEQRDAEAIEMPRKLVALVGKDEAQRLMHAQEEVRANRRSTMRNELIVLDQAKALAMKELEALKLQRTRIEEQVELRRRQRDKVAALLARGLTVADRRLEEDLKLSDLEEKAANISVAIARVQATIAAFDRDALNVKQRRQAEIDTELLRLEREIAQTRLEIQAADRDLAQMLGGQQRSPAANSQVVSYSIVRSQDGKMVSIRADETTAVRPGDVITVSPAAE